MGRVVPANPARAAAGAIETAKRNARAPRGGDSPLAGPFYTDGSHVRMPRKMRKGSGAPSLCWHCLRQLQRAPGRGLGLLYFHLVRDRAGVEHRVHGDCLRPALEGGNATLVPEGGT